MLTFDPTSRNVEVLKCLHGVQSSLQSTDSHAVSTFKGGPLNVLVFRVDDEDVESKGRIK